MMDITLAIIVVTVIGIVGAIILVVAAKFFEVEEDERIGLVAAELPGANCGACGYAGCSDYAKAVVEKGDPVNKCVVGGEKASAAVAAVMGVEAGATVKKHAVVLCQGNNENCHTSFDYQGVKSCAAAAGFYGGPSACKYGCMGFGDCVEACQFGAIHVEDGLSIVDESKCTGCGACAEACPKHIISIVDAGKKAEVLCQNKEKGAVAMKQCATSCIGCMKCQKTCQHEAITIENFLSTIDPAKCVGCGDCIPVCPKNCIVMGD